MNRTFLIVLIALGCLAVACTSEEFVRDGFLHDDFIQPIQFDRDTIEIQLQDFAKSHWKQIDSLTTEDDILIQSKDSCCYLLIPEGEIPPVGMIRFHAGDRRLDVPFFGIPKDTVEFVFRGDQKKMGEVALIGEMTDWQSHPKEMYYEEGHWRLQLALPPGNYQYKYVVNGEELTDPVDTAEVPNGNGGWNSIVRVGSPNQHFPEWYCTAEGSSVQFHGATGDVRWIAFWNNQKLADSESNTGYHLDLEQIPIDSGRSHLRIYPYTNQKRGPGWMFPLERGRPVNNVVDIGRNEMHAARMYFLMVDRFFNGNPENDAPLEQEGVAPLADFMGGDLAGVVQKVEKGYFKDMGFNTIWLSPIVENPDGAFGLWNQGGVRSRFSAYHGYWPIAFRGIDQRFGRAGDLQKLVNDLHNNNSNLLLDLVSNHVHEQHPILDQAGDQKWMTDLYLPDGSLNTEQWDQHRLTTWFDTFLPTLNLENRELAELVADSAMYWLETFSVDGFRHDATKHIPISFWRTLTEKVEQWERRNQKQCFQIGETYGSPSLIRSYINAGLLDAQFDFNVYDALVRALCVPESSFEDLWSEMQKSWDHYGYHHLMGNMSGNQDKARFMSLATGEVRTDEDSKLAGWTREIDLQSEKGFQRLAMMHALNFSIPGIPVLYYGDEIGFPGGNDPDNRRMMQFENLSPQELRLKETVSKLASFRGEWLPLQWGITEPLKVEDDLLAFWRVYNREAVVCIFNKSQEAKKIDIELPISGGQIQNTLFDGPAKMKEGELTLEVHPGGWNWIHLNNLQYE